MTKDDPSPQSAEIIPLRRPAAPCPVCNKPSTAENRPFCSKRCADVDLGRWLDGGYRIETDEPAGLGDDFDDGA